MIVFDTSTKKARLIDQENFFHFFIEAWFKKEFSERIAKQATEEFMSAIEFSDINFVIKFDDKFYSLDVTEKSVKKIGKDEEHPLFPSYTADFGFEAMDWARTNFHHCLYDNDYTCGVLTPIFDLHSISVNVDGNIVCDDESQIQYTEVISNILSYYFSKKNVELLTKKICDYFAPEMMLSVKTQTEKFYVDWSCGEIQIIASDTPTMTFRANTYRDDIEDIVRGVCGNYNKFLKEVCDSLYNHTFKC